MDVDIVIFAHIDCDNVTIGLLYDSLHDRWGTGRVRLLKYTSMTDLWVPFGITAVILVANTWEQLYEARIKFTDDSIYVCGVCLGDISEVLTELPNFTVHSGENLYGELLHDLNLLERDGYDYQ